MPDQGRYRAAPARLQRQREERLQRGELASAVGEARAARHDLDELTARAQAARVQLEQASRLRDEQTTAARRVLAERFASHCRQALAAATDAVAVAEAALTAHDSVVDAAQRALARARAEREVIERHFARWREAQRKLAERRAD
jgi:hypothetical protein